MTNIKVVIGASFGDEGKGLMSDYFCHQAVSKGEDCVVVLSNGGAQRGHTVTLVDGTQHVFHHFGSGTFTGAHTYCISDYILNPMTFVKEYYELTQLGYRPSTMIIESHCRWSTPFDMITNQILEASRGDAKHGSCGMGIWETSVRYQRLKNQPTLEEFDIWSRDKKLEFLKDCRAFMITRLAEEGISHIPDEWYEIVNSETLLQHFIDDVRFMVRHTIPAFLVPLTSFKNIVFENGQGLLLDQDLTFYGNNTTPSATGSTNAIKTINKYFSRPSDELAIEMCYVSRTYMTRHGVGRFETECKKELLNKDMFDETNVTNPFQDNLRYGELILPNLVTRVSQDFSRACDLLVNKKHASLVANVAMTHTNEYEVDYARIRDKLISNIYTSNARTRDSVKLFTEF